MTPDGAQITVAYPPTDVDTRAAYYNFGELCKLTSALENPTDTDDTDNFQLFFLGRVERSRTKLLFQENLRPINDPMLFAARNYVPVFDPHYAYPRDQPLYSFEEIRVSHLLSPHFVRIRLQFSFSLIN